MPNQSVQPSPDDSVYKLAARFYSLSNEERCHWPAEIVYVMLLSSASGYSWHSEEKKYIGRQNATMSFHPYLYQRPTEFHSSPPSLASPFLPQHHRPQFSLPLGGPFPLPGGAPGPPGFPYCGTAPGIANGGGAVMGMGQNLLLAEYLAHPDYYRQLRAAAGFEPKDDGIKDNPKATLDGKKLWDIFFEHGTEMVITKSGR
ncbi:T-box transcription factor TBX2 [Elysia marginata]|uniref:T-box transcription factor TBX2 n=1 Tax=Elysia marginata TaxID=1093978 RepID=A0AAV4GL80_9GAST|nr:T-box transcription factor TBX2 [Elysia marginata]